MGTRKLFDRFKFAFIIALLLFCSFLVPGACSRKAAATEIKIDVVGDDLEEWRPTSVSVERGGTVTWVNNGNEIHSVISVEHLWSEQKLSPQESFDFTFPNVGSFGYRDGSETFAGTIFVK